MSPKQRDTLRSIGSDTLFTARPVQLHEAAFSPLRILGTTCNRHTGICFSIVTVIRAQPFLVPGLGLGISGCKAEKAEFSFPLSVGRSTPRSLSD